MNHSHPLPCLAVAAMVASSAPDAAQAGEMYRCTDGGQATYSDKPCSTTATKITVQPPMPATRSSRAPLPGQAPNRYLPESDAVRVPPGLPCDKQADGPAMHQLARAYRNFEEIRTAAASVPRVGIGSALLELMRSRDAVQAITAKSPCGQAIAAAAARRVELSYMALKVFAAGDQIEHLHIETAATYAGIHYAQGRQLYGF